MLLFLRGVKPEWAAVDLTSSVDLLVLNADW